MARRSEARQLIERRRSACASTRTEISPSGAIPMTTTTRVLSQLLALAFVAVATPSKNCDELKKEIADKLDAKGVKNYTLDVVAKDDVKDGMKVIGSCEAGTKKIIYTRK
jgi:hypothetical protein